MTDAVTSKLVKLMLIIYADEHNSYVVLCSWLFLRRRWGDKGLSVQEELSVSRQQKLQTWLRSWLIWLKYSTLLTPWCLSLTFPRTGTTVKMERIAIASAWSSEDETPEREERVGKEKNAIWHWGIKHWKKSQNLNFHPCSQWPWANHVTSMWYGIKAHFYCTLGITGDSVASKCHLSGDRHRYAEHFPSQSKTTYCVTWWENTFPLISALAASGRPKEDVAADSFVHLDLIFALLLYTNQLHLTVQSVFPVHSLVWQQSLKKMVWVECTTQSLTFWADYACCISEEWCVVRPSNTWNYFSNMYQKLNARAFGTTLTSI